MYIKNLTLLTDASISTSQNKGKNSKIMKLFCNFLNFSSTDFWEKLFEWNYLKILAIVVGICSYIGSHPLLLNVIVYNLNVQRR